MSKRFNPITRRLLLLALGGTALASLGTSPLYAAGDEQAATTIQFSYDRAIDAISAPFVLATTRGLYRAENLTVNSNVAAGSKETIARVASAPATLRWPISMP
jgi:NitT/TauT family transport system substrate-binding protein